MTTITGWFNKDQKPLNGPGVFKTRAKGIGEGYSFFNGKWWGNQRPTPEEAENSFHIFGASGIQSKEWAGRTTPAI